MSTDPGNRKASLIEMFKAVGAIVALPLALFAFVNSFAEQPIIAWGVVLVTAILASVCVVHFGWTGIREMIIAWLILIVVGLAGRVLWPRTMTVEGTIFDTANTPVSHEKVVLHDAQGLIRETYTDAEGHYQFKDVPCDTYKVKVGEHGAGGRPSGIFPVTVMYTDLIIAKPTPTSTPTTILVPTDTPIPPTPSPQPVAIIPTDTPTPVPPTDTPTPMPALPTDTPIPAPPADTPTPEPPTPTPTATPALTPEPDAGVNTEILNLRSGPGVVYGVLAVLERGDSLKVTGRNLAGDWLKVVTPGGQEGWAACSLLQVNIDMAGVAAVAQVPPTPTPMYTPTPTATPTPELLPPPIPLEPKNEASFIGGPVILKWKWDYRSRAPDEVFSVRVRREGETKLCHHAQAKDLEYRGSLTYCAAGNHYWSVALVRDLRPWLPEDDERRWQDLSEESAERWFYYVPSEEPWTWPAPPEEEEERPGEEPIDL